MACSQGIGVRRERGSLRGRGAPEHAGPRSGTSNPSRRAIDPRRLPAARLIRQSLTMETHDSASPEQLEALRRLTPQQRYKAGRRLYWTLRKHKRAFLQSIHPDWSKAQLDEQLRQIFLNART